MGGYELHQQSAGLSEAINFMFKWHSNAQVCYAYLADVGPTQKTHGPFILTYDEQRHSAGVDGSVGSGLSKNC